MSFLNQSLFFYVAMVYAFIEILDHTKFFKHEYFDSHTKKDLISNLASFILSFGVLFFVLGNIFSNKIYSIFVALMISLSLINFQFEKHKMISKKIFILSGVILFFIIEKFIPFVFYFDSQLFLNVLINVLVAIAIGIIVFFFSSAIGKNHVVCYLTLSVIAFLFGEMVSKMGFFSVIIYGILNKNILFVDPKKKAKKEIKKQNENLNFLKYLFRIIFFLGLITYSFPLIKIEIFMIVGFMLGVWFLFQNKTINISVLPLLVLLYINKNMVGFENYFLYAYSIIFYFYLILLIFNFKMLYSYVKRQIF